MRANCVGNLPHDAGVDDSRTTARAINAGQYAGSITCLQYHIGWLISALTLVLLLHYHLWNFGTSRAIMIFMYHTIKVTQGDSCEMTHYVTE